MPAADCFLLLLAGWAGAFMVEAAMLTSIDLVRQVNVANQYNLVAYNHSDKMHTLGVETVAARDKREIESDDEMATGRIL